METVLENQGIPSLIVNVIRISILSVILIAFLKWYLERRSFEHSLRNLPTNTLRPFNFLGHMIYLASYYVFTYPAPFHAYHITLMSGFSKAYGKDGMCLVWQVQHPTLLLYKADTVEMILNNSTEIKKAWFYRVLHPWLGDGLLTSHGSKWRQRRKLLTPAFHFNILRDFLPVFNKQAKILADDVLQNYTSKESVDIVPLMTKCSFDAICETILGEEMHSQTLKQCDYLNSIMAITDVLADRVLKPWYWPDLLFAFTIAGWKHRYHLRKLRRFTTELIARKKKMKVEAMSRGVLDDIKQSSEDDAYHSRKRRALLDLLLDEHIQSNSISETDIREEVDTFTFEGHDTTAMALSWSLYMIGQNRDVQAKVHAELDSIFGLDDRDPTIDDIRSMKYLECVLKESLRLYPSVPGYGRQLQEDIEFKGYKIPKGCVCFVWAYELHRDPEVFPDPEKFDPDRFTPENIADRHPFAYVPFSAGPRNCIGQKFAMLEEKSILSRVLRKYDVLSLEPRDRVHDVFEVVLRPYGGLKLQFRKRKR